ncbi:MAG TPA: VacJ family lipoprotein, partial [Gammaproteobacteria bacterium]|nr:VacJ family lipoprotein [Gammaproteobacteria bacterium]
MSIARLLNTLSLLAVLGLGGCASVPGPPDERDPFESFNRAVYAFNDAADREVFRPIATDYRDHVPRPVRTGISNFFGNLQDVIVLVNDLLQLKIEQGMSDFGRIVYNTTFGLLGIIDVATPMGLPKHDEDFGQTLGYWGVPAGPYLVLPFLGPSSARDTVGLVGDIYVHPMFQGLITDEAVSWGAVGLRYIDLRAQLLGATRVVDEAALDPYAFVRDAYLQRRRNLVYDGNPPPDPRYDFIPDDSTDADLELELQLELDKPK